jgi:hypothetical protein
MPEITDDQHKALNTLDHDRETRHEFAIVYYKNGQPVAEGPFDQRRLAEARARAKGGTIVERPVTTEVGSWAPSDPGPPEDEQ